MRLAELHIENFRSILDETIIFNNYTCFIGPNGSGKSTVFTALNIFFRNSSVSETDLINLDEEDFHHRQTENPIRITLTFEDLSAEAQEDFRDYYRQGKLIISSVATWDPHTKLASVKQYGQRLVMQEFKTYFEAFKSGASAKDLKNIYDTLRATFTDLPEPGSKAVNLEALRVYENSHKEKCALTQSEDQFYGVSHGKDKLEKYIQWVFIPAIKNASAEQTESKKTALGQLIERTIRSKQALDEPLKKFKEETHLRYAEILSSQQNTLDSLSSSLSSKLKNWAHPESGMTLRWQNDVEKLINISQPLAEVVASEGKFKGKIMRFGHGFQRCFIFTLLQELADNGDNEDIPKLLLACEEPELFQHPPQSRYLATVFQKLSEQNSQIMICTHSPYFVSGKVFEDVRLVRKKTQLDQTFVQQIDLDALTEDIVKATSTNPMTLSDIEIKINQILLPSINEIFFSEILILVEGLEDSAFLHTYLLLADKLEDFRKLGCHLVPCNSKSNIVQPLAIARLLNIPTFIIYDSDANDTKNGHLAMHEKDNKALQILSGAPTVNPFPPDHLWLSNLIAWKDNIGDTVEEEVGADWENICNVVKSKYNIHIGGVEKNSMFIGYALTEAWKQGKKSPSLLKAIEAIIDFAEQEKKKA